MATIEESVDVEVPVRTAYNQWTQFEEFPNFMEGVEEVRQKEDDRLYWRASVGGKTEEWEARITEQVPDERVAWQATHGLLNSGLVTFQPLGDDRTRVTVRMEWDDENFVEKVGSALGLDSRRVNEDLERFKEMIEARGRETGAWRGDI